MVFVPDESASRTTVSRTLNRAVGELSSRARWLEEERRRREEEERRRLEEERRRAREALERIRRQAEEMRRAAQPFEREEGPWWERKLGVGRGEGGGIGGQFRRLGGVAKEAAIGGLRASQFPQEQAGAPLAAYIYGKAKQGELRPDQLAGGIGRLALGSSLNIARRSGLGLPRTGPEEEYEQQRAAYQRFRENPDIPLGVKVGAEVLTDPTMYIAPGVLGGLAKTGKLGRVAATVIEGPARRGILPIAVGSGAGAEVASRTDIPGVPESAEMIGGSLLGGLAGAVGPDILRAGARAARTQDEAARRVLVAIQDERGEVDFSALDQLRAKGAFEDLAVREGRKTGGLFDEVKPTEPVQRGIYARYEGGLNRPSLEIGGELRAGNKALKKLGIGKSDGRTLFVKHSPEMEQLFKALHGEAEVPSNLRHIYDDIKRILDVETARTGEFKPDFVPRDDYFYRGWRQPKRTAPGTRQVGGRPGFLKQRNEMTFTQMLDEGWEPLSWNPYEMLALRRQAGESYRAGLELVRRFRESGFAHEVKSGDPMPPGYSVPRVGPAFEGKFYPFIADKKVLNPLDMLDQSEEAAARMGRTSQWALPEDMAKKVEELFGYDPDMGGILNRAITAGEKLKRVKLLGSFFQQMDFLTRTGATGFGGAIDALIQGQPLTAVKRLVRTPFSLGEVAWANLSPRRRDALRAQLLSTNDLFKDRPGLSMRNIVDAGMGTHDTSIIRDVVRESLKDVQAEARGVSAASKPWRVIKGLNQATQNGLFDGTYRQAQIIAVKEHIGPRIIHQHPDWTNAQLARAIADEVNIRLSTIGGYQSIFQSPATRKLLRGLIFSTNESEALIKQSLKPFFGTEKLLAAEYWAGGMLFLGATAEAVHYLATGEHLPLERYVPVERDPHSPLGIRYARNFIAPDVPGLKGRGGTNLTLDLMGQLDTVFRTLDPKSFLSSRESVPLRAITTQVSGKDFFGRSVRSPKERIANLGADLFEPIPLAQLRGALDFGPESEARLGGPASAIQATGLNFRAETNAMVRDRIAQEQFGKNWEDLESNERQQVLTDHPNEQQELERRLDEAVAQGSDWAIAQTKISEYRDDAREGQLADDEAYEKGEITGEQYRLRESQRVRTLRDRIEGIKAMTPPYAGSTRENDPLTRFAAVLDRAISPDGVTVDHEMIDQFFASLSQGEQDYVSRNTGLYDTPLQKQKAVEVRTIAESGYWKMEQGRAQFLRDHADIRELVKKWGYSSRLTAYLDTEDTIRDAQAAADEKYARDPNGWKEKYKQNRDRLYGAGQALFGDNGNEATGIVQQWFQVISASKDAAGDVDWDQVDRWIAGLSADSRRELEEYEGRSLTPKVKQYRDDVKKIAVSGYWDIADEYAKRYAARFGLDPATATWKDLQARVWQDSIDRFKQRGYGEEQAFLLAGRIVDRRLKRVEDIIARRRKLMRRRDRQTALLLARWGFWNPGQDDSRILARIAV